MPRQPPPAAVRLPGWPESYACLTKGGTSGRTAGTLFNGPTYRLAALAASGGTHGFTFAEGRDRDVVDTCEVLGAELAEVWLERPDRDPNLGDLPPGGDRTFALEPLSRSASQAPASAEEPDPRGPNPWWTVAREFVEACFDRPEARLMKTSGKEGVMGATTAQAILDATRRDPRVGRAFLLAIDPVNLPPEARVAVVIDRREATRRHHGATGRLLAIVAKDASRVEARPPASAAEAHHPALETHRHEAMKVTRPPWSSLRPVYGRSPDLVGRDHPRRSKLATIQGCGRTPISDRIEKRRPGPRRARRLGWPRLLWGHSRP